MYKVLTNNNQSLCYYSVNGDLFESFENRFFGIERGQPYRKFEIRNWKSLSPKDLSDKIQSFVGSWYNDIQIKYGDYKFEDPEFLPGEHIPNVFRPVHHKTASDKSESLTKPNSKPREFKNSITVALRRLSKKLDHLLEFIEPTKDNLSSYGSANREFLILCCTELEGALKQVLRSNGCKPVRTHYTMKDYFKARRVLLLSEYQVYYGDRITALGKTEPYKKWNTNRFRQLGFYDAYNKVKHDPLKNLKLATLENCLEAYSAYVIASIAILGSSHISDYCGEAKRFFGSVEGPKFDHRNMYFYDFKNEKWTQKSTKF